MRRTSGTATLKPSIIEFLLDYDGAWNCKIAHEWSANVYFDISYNRLKLEADVDVAPSTPVGYLHFVKLSSKPPEDMPEDVRRDVEK
ncbi:MAG: hypothetical protein QXE79_04160 [Candidatus Bathyarchaeia archaeon]